MGALNFGEAAPTLLTQGYRPTPTNGKAAFLPEWERRSLTPEDIEQYKACNVGIVCGEVLGLDLDILDVKVRNTVYAAWRDALPEFWAAMKTSPRRYGKEPKVLHLFRAAQPGITKREIKLLPPGEEREQKIEVLATGQQFVAYGIHPDTHKPYKWNGAGEPCTVRVESLPVLDVATIDALLESAHKTLTALGWTGKVRDRGGVTSAILTRPSGPAIVVEGMPAAIGRALERADPDDRESWVAVGHALKAANEDWAEEAWLAWSQQSGKWRARDADKWESFKPVNSSLNTLMRATGVSPFDAVAEAAEAKRIGEGEVVLPTKMWEPHDALREWVFISEGSRVALRSLPHLGLPLGEWRNHTAASLVDIGTAKKPRMVPLTDLWLKAESRITRHTVTFAPGQGEWCRSPENVESLNLWTPTPRVAADVTLARPFFEHVAYLVPDAAECKRFLDWLAHIEQRPEELPQGHYLLVAKETGIGRNWMAYALARVFAGHTALGFDLISTLEGGFNGQLSRKLLAVVDELHEGMVGTRDRARIGDRLKSMLTEETRRINPKYGRQHTEFNCCRFLMFSNHDAALPLSENDRRVFVIENPTERKKPTYYTHLYALLKDTQFINAVRAALAARDISGFNPGEIAHMSKMKKVVINAGRSDIEKALLELVQEWPSDIINTTTARTAIADYMGLTYDKAPKIFDRAAEAVGMRNLRRIKYEQVQHRLWTLRNHEAWAAQTNTACALEMIRGSELRDAAELFE
jgi:hypothetical protein